MLFMLIFSSVILAATSSFANAMLQRDISRRISGTVTEYSRMLNSPMGNDIFPGFRFYDHGVHMAVYNSSGELVGGQIPFGIEGSLPDFKAESLRNITYDGNKYYIYDIEVPLKNSTEKYRLRGIASLGDESYALSSAAKVNILLTFVLTLIASLGGYFILDRAFVPVNKISTAAKEISESSDLSRRINLGKGNDEIAALANTFDEMLEKLEHTFENEKQFTSDASHELRTPVAVILSECEYMTDCADNVEDLKQSAESVKNQAEKMSKLISELLTIARMDRNAIKLSPEETDISELAGFVCSEQEEIEGGGITLKTEIKPGITADVDRLMITRLFVNLISNAYHYNKENGTITVSLDETDTNVIFSVTDSGIGISKEDIPKIWERFYQVDRARTSKDNGSMGLGLSMVKWIAEAHGGNVTVTSELGEGSTFTFTFPKHYREGAD